MCFLPGAGWRKRTNVLSPISVGAVSPLIISAYERSQLSAEAYAALEPQFAKGFSLTNAIFELKDFKSLSRHVIGVGDFLRAQTARKLAAAIAKTADNAISSIASSTILRARNLSSKTLAELTLEYDFAFKPLIADVAKVYTIAEKATDVLSRFNAQGFGTNTFHFTKPLQTSYVHPDIAFNSQPYGTSIRYTGKFHAQCRQSWKHTVDNSLDQFLQQYGLQLSPKNIWDAIPFSFVVDWFYSVGKSLETVSRNTVTNRSIHSYSETYKMEATVARVLKKYTLGFNGNWEEVMSHYGGSSSSHWLGSGYSPVSYARGTTYERSPKEVIPFVYVLLPSWSAPRLRSLVDGLAMVRTAWGFKGSSVSHFNGPH
jgi:hypothetical protein